MPSADPASAEASGHNPIFPRIAIALVAICAPLFAAITFQINWEMTLTRSLSLPVLAVESALIMTAWLGGFRLLPALRAMTRPVRWALAVWLITAGLASQFAVNAPLASFFLAFSLTHLLLAIALWDRFSGPWSAQRGMFMTALTASLLVFVGMTQAITALMWNSPVFNWDQFGAGVVNIRHLGFYAVALTGFGMGTVAANRFGSRWWIGALIAGVGFYFTAWTGGRSPFLSVFIMLVVLTAIMGPQARFKVAGLLVALAALAMPISLVTAPPNPLYGLESIIGRVTPEADVDQNSVARRTELWADTFDAALKQPLIGHGQANWTNAIKASRGQHAHPHNLVMQVLFDWGIVGAFALLALGIMALLRVPRWVTARRDLALPALGAIGCLVVMSMADGPFFFAFPQFVVAVCVAVLASIKLDGDAA